MNGDFKAYIQYCQIYKNNVKQHKTPAQAFLFVLQYGMPHHTTCDDPLEDAWWRAVDLYSITIEDRIDLYQRCVAERKMRRHWKRFLAGYHYEEPMVPPLPI